VEDEKVVEKPKVEATKVKPPIMTEEQIESRKRAHEMKVRKFLAGGEF